MIEELQLHNKSAAVIFLQYQFSLQEGTIILPVSLNISVTTNSSTYLHKRRLLRGAAQEK